ncbi:hypothetical protein CKCE_0439 [Candidatus Kinetoplastibacterium crithidii (ex Angomonas deanei ATCC 30255)]|nr:hypothetical protein CKCE_0439 [Candidatus Kinetoplastibacterium crithidii (ex Angomonas deanei ATCC 30255)]
MFLFLRSAIKTIINLNANSKSNKKFTKEFWSGVNLIDLHKKNHSINNKSTIPKIFESGMNEFSKSQFLERNHSAKNAMEATLIKEILDIQNKIDGMYILINSIFYIGLLGFIMQNIEIINYFSKQQNLDSTFFIPHAIESLLLVTITILGSSLSETIYIYIIKMIKKYSMESRIFIKDFLKIIQKQNIKNIVNK